MGNITYVCWSRSATPDKVTGVANLAHNICMMRCNSTDGVAAVPARTASGHLLAVDAAALSL